MMLLSPLLLILSSLLHTTSSTVYYVIPDDHYTTNNNTYTLQHYLNNANKYFTSHTQLNFLPGQYYLNTDLIIEHVSNLSLIGNRTNEVINSVIKCTSPAGIVVVGSSNIVITNIVMNECGKKYNYRLLKYKIYSAQQANLIAFDCVSVTIRYFHSNGCEKLCGIKFINVWGNTTLSHATTFSINMWYHTEPSNDLRLNTRTIYIAHFTPCSVPDSKYALNIKHYSTYSNLKISLMHINFIRRPALFMSCDHCPGFSMLHVKNCYFSSRNSDSTDSTVNIQYKVSEMSHTMLNQVHFINCRFINNFFMGMIVEIDFFHRGFNLVQVLVSVNQCVFLNNDCTYVCHINNDKYFHACDKNRSTSLLLKDVTFTNHKASSLIHGKCIAIYIEEVVISNITNDLSIITSLKGNVTFHKYCEISNSQAVTAITAKQILLKEMIIVNITHNNLVNVFHYSNFISEYILLEFQSSPPIPIQQCLIQYTSDRGNLDYEFEKGIKLNYSMILYKNNVTQFYDSKIIHCSWNEGSAFLSSVPQSVMEEFFYISNNYIVKPSSLEYRKTLCICSENKAICSKEVLGRFFPGQTVHFNFFFRPKIYHTLFHAHDIILQPAQSRSRFVCNSTANVAQLNSNQCNVVKYKINHRNEKWCELPFLLEAVVFKVEIKKWMERYTILLQPCPKGFSLHPQGYCQCDPILSSHIPSLTTCDIDLQTIPLPANTWISAHTINNSHSYHVSLHCPFDYCLPHSLQLNLSTPDSQCQFNRTGVLCGQCQRGLSTVFVSSQCKHCSNIYLLIIIPLGIAGIALILLLFVLNLTVTDGKVNSFIFYVNIISINASTFFLSDKSSPYTFIALANLDLGIETCFYNGMDDYVKMWLQLVFPIYLIFIATLLIITSRYSTTIQRLTARRALPVLATLFLLSYTKVLLTVSNVLFSYTSITHLPSNHTTLVWSVDTSVPLFGVKFVVLFITSCVLFLLLIAFTVILTCSTILVRFRFLKYFNPLLDAFQSPFKKRFYYWPGLHLLLRMMLWGLSFLNKDTNLISSIAVLGLIICVHERCTPYCSKVNNSIETLFLLNLYSIFVACAYDNTTVIITILIFLSMLKLVCIIVLLNASSWYYLKAICMSIMRKCSFRLPFQISREVKKSPVVHQTQVPLIMRTNK